MSASGDGLTSLAARLIEEEEGRVPHAYQDHLGYWTIGVGHLIDRRKGGKLPDFIIDELLEYDLDEKIGQARTLAGFERLNAVQQAVIISMVFQLGIAGVRGFPAMLRALAAGDVKGAAREMRDSKWAREDTPARAERSARMMETGLWVPKGSV